MYIKRNRILALKRIKQNKRVKEFLSSLFGQCGLGAGDLGLKVKVSVTISASESSDDLGANRYHLWL